MSTRQRPGAHSFNRDALVSCGLLAADDYHHVIGPDHRHGGIGNPEIVLEIIEITQEESR